MLFPDHIFIRRIQKCNKVMSQCQMEKLMSLSNEKKSEFTGQSMNLILCGVYVGFFLLHSA